MKNLTTVIVASLALILTACGGDDGSEGGNAAAHLSLTPATCSQSFTYNESYSRQQNTDAYGQPQGHDKYYDSTINAGEKYIQTSIANNDTYISESGDQTVSCDRVVQPTYTPTAPVAPTVHTQNTYVAPPVHQPAPAVVHQPQTQVYPTAAPQTQTTYAPAASSSTKKY